MEEKNTKKFNKILILDLFIVCLMTFLDQITKYVIRLKQDTLPIPIIKNVLEISYLENEGAAFGMLQKKQLLFVIIFAFVIVGIIIFLFKIPKEKKFNKLHIVLSLILAGAIGNTIDRIMKQSVTDFIYFKLINFPLFNVADICLTCATILLVLFIIFGYKDDDFAFIKGKKKDTK